MQGAICKDQQALLLWETPDLVVDYATCKGNAETLIESKFEGSLQGIATTMESCKMYITGKALVVLC